MEFLLWNNDHNQSVQFWTRSLIQKKGNMCSILYKNTVSRFVQIMKEKINIVLNERNRYIICQGHYPCHIGEKLCPTSCFPLLYDLELFRWSDCTGYEKFLFLLKTRSKKFKYNTVFDDAMHNILFKIQIIYLKTLWYDCGTRTHWSGASVSNTTKYKIYQVRNSVSSC